MSKFLEPTLYDSPRLPNVPSPTPRNTRYHTNTRLRPHYTHALTRQSTTPPSTLITSDTLARHSTKVATTQTPSPNAPHHSLRHALTRTDSTIFPTTHKPSPITPRHSPRFAPTRPPLHDTPLKLSRHTCPRPAPRHSPPTRSRPPFDRNALARHSALAHPRSGL